MTGENQWPDLEAFAQIDIVKKMETMEYSGVAEMIRQFDVARKELYNHTKKVMQGRGGKTRNEALAHLTALREHAAAAYSGAGVAIIHDSANLGNAVTELSNLFLADEQERIEKLRILNPKGIYKPLSEEVYGRRIEKIILSADDENPIEEQLRKHQDQCLSIDLDACLKAIPPNIQEVEALNHQMRKERMRAVAIQIGQMAGTAMIAAAATSFLHKRSR